LRNAFHDVEQHDVAELLEADEVSERAADLAGADQRNLITRHDGKTLDMMLPRGAADWLLSGPASRNKATKEDEASHRSCIHYTN
jgi:hypothetical protein